MKPVKFKAKETVDKHCTLDDKCVYHGDMCNNSDTAKHPYLKLTMKWMDRKVVGVVFFSAGVVIYSSARGGGCPDQCGDELRVGDSSKNPCLD